MPCRHQIHFQVLGCFLLVFLIGGFIGETSARIGKRVIAYVGAMDRGGERELLERVKRRQWRKERQREGERSERAARAVHRKNLSERFAVALHVGTLSYPRLGISAPVGKPSLTEWQSRNWYALERQMQFGLLHGVVAYPHSPPFGTRGNIIIAGHSSAPTLEVRGSAYEDIFASLPEAERGDRIELRDEQGITSLYEIYDTAVIPPTETSILLQDERSADLTLFTCYPVGTTRERFMVRARLRVGQPSIAGGEEEGRM